MRPAGALVLGLATVAGLGASYWMGMRNTSPTLVPAPNSAQAPVHAAHSAPKEREILYYQDPTGKAEYSREPKKDAEGRDYVAVHAEEEPAPPSPPPPPAGKGRVLYYRNPMGLSDVSPVPKKDSMGMDYVPVHEGEESAGMVRIGLDKVQKLGVRTEAAGLRRLARTVRAAGAVHVDERRLAVIAPKFDGFIEVLHVDTMGQAVARGQSLMEVYSPDLVLAQEEYVAATGALRSLGPEVSTEARDSARKLADSAIRRLRNWDVSEDQVERLRRQGAATRTLSLSSPATGVVLEKKAVRGMRFMAGEELYRIADLGSVWIIAEVFEQDLAQVSVGQPATVTFNALPGITLQGKVTFIYPTLSAETRTVKVRIELPNPEGRLKPAFYATVDFATQSSQREVVAVPDSALIDSGQRQVVLVERGEGLFEPRQVKAGTRANGFVEIVEGIKGGERVVVSANFLIDAESNLRAALQGFGSANSHAGHGGR